jgi:uncharacterized glyoxalase superfamily protein PhnB
MPGSAGITLCAVNLNPQSGFRRRKNHEQGLAHSPRLQLLTPYLIIKGAAQAIEYCKKVFGATEVFRLDQPDGKVGHAELKIGDSRIMLADENPNMGAGHASAASIGASPVSLYLYIPDVDRAVERRRRCGRENSEAGAGPVLRRPLRLHPGSIWTSLGRRNSHRRCGTARIGRAREEGDAGRVICSRRPAVFRRSPTSTNHEERGLRPGDARLLRTRSGGLRAEVASRLRRLDSYCSKRPRRHRQWRLRSRHLSFASFENPGNNITG